MQTNREKITELIKEFEEQKNNGLMPGSYLCCAEIGRELGISRQRVHEIIGVIGWPKIPDGLVPAKEASITLRYCTHHLWRLVQKGKLYGVKVGDRCYYDTSSLSIGFCRECGNPLPRYRSEHCCNECLGIAQYKSNQKSQWRAFTKRWKAGHSTLLHNRG